MKAYTHLVSAHIVNDRDVQVGASMIEVVWEHAPRDRAEANAWTQEITEREWASGSLSRAHRYRITGWSEYAR